jgi:hypothetical protein
MGSYVLPETHHYLIQVMPMTGVGYLPSTISIFRKFGCCKNDNEILGSLRGGEFLAELILSAQKGHSYGNNRM